MDQLNSGIAVHSTDKHQQASVSDASTLPVFNEPVPNFQFQIIVPLAHEMWKHQWNLQHGPTTFSQNRRTSPFICFGAHQYPNSNMSNVLTQYLTLMGTLLHNTFSDSPARRRMGSEKQKGGGVGQQAVGQTQHPSRNCGISAEGGRAKKSFLRFFLRNPFLRRAQSQKLNFLRFFFFCAKLHLGPGINCFRN